MGSGCYFGVAPGGGRERRGCPGSRRGGGGGDGGGKAAAICGAAPARADPVAEVPPVRRGSRPSCSQRGVTLGVRVGDDGKRRYRPGEALPGVPRCGCRRTPLSASRGGAYPGDAGHPSGPWAARSVRPVEPGAAAGKVAGGTRPDRSGAGAWEGGGGWGGRVAGPPHPVPWPASRRTAPGGSGAGGRRGKKKKTDGKDGLRKTNPQNAVSGVFRFHFCFPLPPPYTPFPLLPWLRGRGSVAAASVSPGAAERRGGSVPIAPRGNGAKLAVHLPLPFAAAGEVGEGGLVPGSPSRGAGRRRRGPGGCAGREARTAAR